MVLAIDIGNTNITMGGYENGALQFDTRVSTDRSLETDQYALQIDGILRLRGVDTACLTGAVLSSVVPQITDAVAHAVETVTHLVPLRISQASDTGITVKIDRPAELGIDLLVGAMGAVAGYPLPAIVIDMGTATKITAIDTAGAVLGCSISPGVFVSLNALTSTASALGGIAVHAPDNGSAIGKNTTYSMQSGVVFGAAAMLDGMIDRFALELGEPATVLATGGAAGCIVRHCHHNVHHVPTLLLDGLYAAYQNLIR